MFRERKKTDPKDETLWENTGFYFDSRLTVCLKCWGRCCGRSSSLRPSEPLSAATQCSAPHDGIYSLQKQTETSEIKDRNRLWGLKTHKPGAVPSPSWNSLSSSGPSGFSGFTYAALEHHRKQTVRCTVKKSTLDSSIIIHTVFAKRKPWRSGVCRGMKRTRFGLSSLKGKC